MSVTIVAASWNHLDTTTRPCLDSLLRYTDGPYRVIWVDDASGDDTPRFLRETAARDPRVEVVLRGNNGGWAEAMRTGLRGLRPDDTYLCLLNSDVILTPGWLSRLLTHLERPPAPTAVIPNEYPDLDGSQRGRLRTVEPAIVPGTATAAPPPPLARVLEFAGRVAEQFAGRSEPADPSGFCLLVRRREAGLLDAYLRDFPRYHSGERDWRQLWEAHGATCRVALDVFVFHTRGGSGGYYRYHRQRPL